MVNHLHFNEPIDAALFVSAENDLVPEMRAIDGFEGFHVVQTSERDAILVILGDSAETLDRVATEVGSPWMRANVVPLLAGPPERHIGPIAASTLYS